jgi:glycosyltransferase involved in cell wall biosynthesis
MGIVLTTSRNSPVDQCTVGGVVPSSVLTLVGTYLPGYKGGGPIRSIENLVATFGEEFHFRIVTQDRDLGDRLPFPGIAVNRWSKVGHADVMYLRPGLNGLLRMWKQLRSVDSATVLYLNSFFARRFSILAVLMRSFGLCQPRCLLLAPRGEFSPGALQFKRIRKMFYLRMSRWLGLYQGLIWHASSDFEAADIRRQFPLTEDIEIAGIAPTSPAADRKKAASQVVTASDIFKASLGRITQRQKEPGRLRVVFVSRLTRKKNLSGALTMLQGITGQISFDIYGPAEDAGYWRECQELIASLPPNIQVRYRGEIEHERIGQVFAEHELFLFPTLGENYGHVISEALVEGCPVLISDQTPWRNLREKKVGWDIPLGETKKFQEVLQQCVDAEAGWYTALSTRAANYAAESGSDPKILDANRRLFRRAISWLSPYSSTDL